MTNRFETYEQFVSVCTMHKKEKNPLIVTVFENDGAKLDENRLHSYLNLRGNNYHHKTLPRISNDDIFVLYHTLKINSCICDLDLRFNRINDQGAHWIAKLLIDNEILQRLNLMCNDIGPDGAEQLGLALQKNTHLKYINLNGNKIGNKGGMCMAQMLQVNTSLEHLDLGDTDQVG